MNKKLFLILVYLSITLAACPPDYTLVGNQCYPTVCHNGCCPDDFYHPTGKLYCLPSVCNRLACECNFNTDECEYCKKTNCVCPQGQVVYQSKCMPLPTPCQQNEEGCCPQGYIKHAVNDVCIVSTCDYNTCNCGQIIDICDSCKGPNTLMAVNKKSCSNPNPNTNPNPNPNPKPTDPNPNSNPDPTPSNSSCHSSCNCQPNTPNCLSCKDFNSTKDIYNRSCSCNAGYYQKQTNPFECAENIKDTSGNPTDPIVLSKCHTDIGKYTKDLKIKTDCSFVAVENYVKLKFELDFSAVTMDTNCKGEYTTIIQYLLVNTVSTYVDLPTKYITDLPNGGKLMKIPLIDVYNLCHSQTVNDDQIVQIMYVRAKIGYLNNIKRIHRWTVYVYTNRNQVEIFNIDVDIQETEGCQPGQQCIVIADLDTLSKICDNGGCNSTKQVPKYLVGDIFYAKIWFADATYKKKLSFQKLYFKTDSNKIFNFSSITSYSSQLNGLYIQLPLVQPSQGAVIQVNMKINPVSRRLRNLEENDEVDAKKQFTVSIDQTTDSANASQNTSGMKVIFGLINLICFVLLF